MIMFVESVCSTPWYESAEWLTALFTGGLLLVAVVTAVLGLLAAQTSNETYRLESATTSGFVCNFDDHVTGNLVLKNEFEAFGRHIPSLDHPFFALLDKNHRHETQGGFA